MPELPEVETLRRQLEKIIPGSEVLGIEVLDKDRIGELDNACSRVIEEVGRDGKFLKFKLSDGKEIVVHLRMTGHLQWLEKGPVKSPPFSEAPRHARLTIDLPHGRICLIDPRRFATVVIRNREEPASKSIDAYADRITGKQLAAAAKSRKIPVKNFLLDQKSVAGLGNIYVCEILFRAGINPWKKSCDVSMIEWNRIVRQFKPVLGKAIICRGSSISDWKDLLGDKGSYQEHLQVYGREGEACFRCGTSVMRRPIGGRSTFYCPKCQSDKAG